MGKSSPKSPPPPDPVATANAQTTSNIQTAEANARLNRINEYNPYYSVLYSRPPGSTNNVNNNAMVGRPTPISTPSPYSANDFRNYENGGQAVGNDLAGFQTGFDSWVKSGRPDNPMIQSPGQGGGGAAGYGDGVPEPSTYERRIQLNPDQQRIFDSQQATDLGLSQLAGESVQRVRDTMAKPFNYDGIPKLMSGQQMDAERQRVEQAMFDRLNPQLDRDSAALEQRLADQGIAIGSQAYSSAMGDQSRARNDARLAVTGQGLRETQGLFGLDQSRRQQGIQERAYQRSYPINEIATLLGTAGGVDMPQFQGVPQANVAGTDVTGPIYANYQNAMNAYNQQNSSRNAAMGGLFGLAGRVGGGMASNPAVMAAMFSDRRLKTDIEQIGEDPVTGLPIYTYRYLWDERPTIGFMADEVAEFMPKAVGVRAGFLTVNYAMLGV